MTKINDFFKEMLNFKTEKEKLDFKADILQLYIMTSSQG